MKKVKFNAIAMRPYMMLLPTFAILCVFMFYPIFNTFVVSFKNYVLSDMDNSGFNAGANFKTLMHDEIFFKSLKNSAVWTVLNVVLQAVFGLIAALILNMQFKGRGIFRTLIFTPWAVGGMLVALIWGFMYNESIGVVNDLLLKVGVIDQRMSWFSNGTLSMWALTIANTWRGIPFFAISILASLQMISSEIYESAKVDGVNSWNAFWKITLPLIKDTLLLTVLLRTIWTLNVVDIIYGMTNGGPNNSTLTLPVYIMKVFQDSLDAGYASTIAVVLMILMLIFSAIYLKLGKYGEGGHY